MRASHGTRISFYYSSDTSSENSTTDDTDDTDGRESTLILSEQSVVNFPKCRWSASPALAIFGAKLVLACFRIADLANAC